MPLRHPVKFVYIGHREEGDKGAVRLLRTSGSPRVFNPRDDKVCGIVNTRGGDFRSATLYSSPPPAHPTMGFCELEYLFDDAGPRRVSNLNFLRKVHSFNHSHEADTEADVVVAVARVVVVAVGRTQVRACIVPRPAPNNTVGARCPRLAPKV